MDAYTARNLNVTHAWAFTLLPVTAIICPVYMPFFVVNLGVFIGTTIVKVIHNE